MERECKDPKATECVKAVGLVVDTFANMESQSAMPRRKPENRRRETVTDFL